MASAFADSKVNEENMKRIGQLGVAMLLVIAACSEGTSPSKVTPTKSGAKAQRHASAQAVDQAGNNFYRVFVNADQAAGIGEYTITTGANHPVTISTGSPQNVLFGDGEPGTSYNSFFSYTTGTTYVATSFNAQPNLVVLDPVGVDGLSYDVYAGRPATNSRQADDRAGCEHARNDVRDVDRGGHDHDHEQRQRAGIDGPSLSVGHANRAG